MLSIRRPVAPLHRRLAGVLRTFHARHPVVRWIAAILAAYLTLSTIAASEQASRRARQRWGPGAEVLVAAEPVAAGELLVARSVRRAAVPDGLLPDGAIRSLPVGARASAPIGRGEILVDHRLADADRSAAAARLPPGTRGLTVNTRADVTEIGDLVDLHALVSGRALTLASPVVATGEGWITVGVPVDAVDAVVDAVTTGGVIVALVP
ncbi:MAG: SAF domain-containing protein [Acidimicrobiales bacterium]